MGAQKQSSGTGKKSGLKKKSGESGQGGPRRKAGGEVETAENLGKGQEDLGAVYDYEDEDEEGDEGFGVSDRKEMRDVIKRSEKRLVEVLHC